MSAPNLLDELIKSQMLLERFKPSTLDPLNEALLAARGDIISRISTTSGEAAKARYAELRAMIDEELSMAYKGFSDALENDFDNAASIGYDTVNTIINEFAALESTPLAEAFDRLPKAAVNRILDKNTPILGSTLKEMAINQELSHKERLRKLIAVHIFEGDSTQKAQQTLRMIDDVEELFGKVSRHEINAITRTSIHAAFSRANDEVYRQHKKLIIGWRSLAVLDGRTSKQCASLDRVFYSADKYDIDEIPNRPPRHMNCRSVLTPETKLSRKIEGERPFAIHDERLVQHRDGSRSTKFTVADAGQVKGSTKFSQWFDMQDKGFQIDYLGPTRYKWYKDGKVSIEELYDRQRNKALTIEELRRKIAR